MCARKVLSYNWSDIESSITETAEDFSIYITITTLSYFAIYIRKKWNTVLTLKNCDESIEHPQCFRPERVTPFFFVVFTGMVYNDIGVIK